MATHSSSNDSFVPQPTSDNVSFSVYTYCLMSSPSTFIYMAFDITIILLMLPLSVFILHHGVQQWLLKRSTSLSHTDCFTYHMVAMELIGSFGFILNLTGICKGEFVLIVVGGSCASLTSFGQIFFHILTCLERYLAVVHPIVYIKLKNEHGIRIRNISIGCVWMLSLVGMSVQLIADFFSIVDLCLFVLSLTIVSYCSISVLLVLIRPGPGEQGEGKERVYQLKRRAFGTILAILAVLVVRFACNVIWEVIFMFGRRSDCVFIAMCDWGNVPSCLVLPLLFLHRAGKSIGCMTKTQSKKEKHSVVGTLSTVH